jgi:hypothetical protein
MIEIKLFLSNNKAEYRFIIQTLTDSISLFGGLFTSIALFFTIFARYYNNQVLLSKNLEVIYLIDKNEMD